MQRRWWWGFGVVGAVIASGIAVGVVSVAEDSPTEGSGSCVGGEDSVVATREVADGVPVVEVLRRGVEPRELVSDWIASSPAISPDGTQVVVSRAVGGSYSDGGPASEELWVVGIDGANPSALTSGGRAVRPSWSPDGGHIVYLATEADGTDGHLAIVRADGRGKPERLADVRVFGADSASTPWWSPDGSTIAIGPDRSLVLVQADDGTRQTVAAFDAEVSSLVWDPDGDTLTVTLVGGDPYWQLVRVDVKDGATTSLGAGFQARWSADGQRLYLLELADGVGRIRISPDGADAGPASAEDLDPPLSTDPRADGSIDGFDVGPCT